MIPEANALLLWLKNELNAKQHAFSGQIDWDLLATCTKEQGVISLAYAGAQSAHKNMPIDLLQNWRRKMLAGLAVSECLLAAQDEIVKKFFENGIPVVILKGSSVARYYPHPELRVLGDIDLLVRQEDIFRATGILETLGYTEYEADHDFHIGYARPGAYVELHYNVTNLPNTPGGEATQARIDHFLDSVEWVESQSYRMPVLTAPNQAISLLLHMIRHMFEGGIGLRQLCDWYVFTDKMSACFAEEILPVLKVCGLLEYAKVATQTCANYLGLNKAHLHWCEDVSDETCRMFMEAVFSGGNMGDANQDGMGSLFTNAATMGEPEISSIRALIKNLNDITYKRFPITQKYKCLAPIFWIVLPVRYMWRAKAGLRPKKSVGKVLSSAKKQRSLYERLHVFEIE